MSNDKEHIDDIFKNHFEEYEPTPPGNVWSRVKNGLGNSNAEETLYNKFDKHQPQPPQWVWTSLSNILKNRQKIKLYKRVAAASLFFISLSGLIASQFAASSTIDSLFSFEKDDNLIVQTTPINPIILQEQALNPAHTPSIAAEKNYTLFTKRQPIIKDILAKVNTPILENMIADNHNLSDIVIPAVIASEPTVIPSPEAFSLASVFANISVPTLGFGIPNIPQNNLNYRAPRHKKPNAIETSIEIFGGASSTFRKIDNNADAHVASIRKESEKASYANQWGIKFNIVKNHLLFTNGIGVSQYNYTGTYIFQKEDSINLRPNFQSPNDPKPFKQEDYYKSYTSIANTNVLTNYKFVSVSSALGYVLNASKKINIIPQIGINTAYLMSNIGPKLNAGKPTEYTKMAEANSLSLNQRMMISAAFAIKVNYKVCDKMNLGIEPFMNSQVNRQTATSPLGGQKLTAKGVNLSLSYKF